MNQGRTWRPWGRSLAVVAALATTACGEQSESGTFGIDDLAAEDAYANIDPGPVTLRRLTEAQYHNVLTDLFGEALVVPGSGEPDPTLGGLQSVGASVSTFSPRAIENLDDGALAIAQQVVESEELRAQAIPCTPSDTVDEACAKQTFTKLGRIAWRRTLTDAEVERFATIAGAAATVLDDFHEGLAYGLAAMLESPSFLYRVELGAVGDDGVRRFTDLELASRLSFLLWNTAPDDTLLQAAEAGKLSSRDGLFEEASRMLDDPRAYRGIRALFTDYLDLWELEDLKKDPKLYEHFSATYAEDAREETLRVLEWLTLDADIDFREVMTTRETFLNAKLASVYGLPAPTADGWGQVAIPEAEQRAGLLGQAAFLASHSHAVSSSATLRGKAVRNILLCQEIPAPPVDVDTSIPEPSGNTLTLRDRVAEHLTNPACAGCHQLTDPIGLGLENYDTLGRWRNKDNGKDIDASGDLDGETFGGPIELAQTIGKHPDFAKCAVETISRYARGRVEIDAEEPWITTLEERFAHHGHRVRPFMLELIMSPMFRRAGTPE